MSATEYFSGFEVIRAAMEVEKNGHRFYSSMVKKAYTDNGLKRRSPWRKVKPAAKLCRWWWIVLMNIRAPN